MPAMGIDHERLASRSGGHFASVASDSSPGPIAKHMKTISLLLPFLTAATLSAQPLDTKQTAAYKRIKAQLDAVPAIDTHDHLWPFDILPGYVETERGRGMNLSSLWRNSYYTWFNSLTPWKPGGKFDDWW